jgi:hypothetical protein
MAPGLFPAACRGSVIPAKANQRRSLAGIQKKATWMPDQVRHDVRYPAACGGVVHFDFVIRYSLFDIGHSVRDLVAAEGRHQVVGQHAAGKQY